MNKCQELSNISLFLISWTMWHPPGFGQNWGEDSCLEGNKKCWDARCTNLSQNESHGLGSFHGCTWLHKLIGYRKNNLDKWQTDVCTKLCMECSTTSCSRKLQQLQHVVKPCKTWMDICTIAEDQSFSKACVLGEPHVLVACRSRSRSQNPIIEIGHDLSTSGFPDI